MKVTKIYKEEDLPIMTHCSMCNTYFKLAWTIGWTTYENFCSNDCSKRYNKVRLNGYPKYSENEMNFWTDWAKSNRQNWVKRVQEIKEIKLAHWLSSKNNGSKVAQKVAQKSGSSSSYIEDEPLSHELVLGLDLEPPSLEEEEDA